MKRILLVTTVLAVSLGSAAADPWISGGEPGWGKHMSRGQRRATGFDDVAAARKANSSVAYKKYAGPVRSVPGYIFNVLTMRHGIYGSGHDDKRKPFSMSQIRSEPFGVYATLQECDIARAKKIAELDAGDSRFPHLPAGAQSITTHFTDGSTSVAKDAESSERKDVTFCEPGMYAPESPKSSDENVAKLGTTQ